MRVKAADEEAWVGDALATSLKNAWHSAAGIPNPPDDNSEAGWTNVAAVASAHFAEAGEDRVVETSASRLAATLYHAYRRVEGCRPESYDDLVPLARLAWEAAGRHAANLLCADPDDLRGELPRLEAAWAGWAAAEFQKRGHGG